ncbi:MAG: hypothetical protein IJI46_09555 [Erysipelotrichaceae bacterium]|nr:hypothetical protein [Erysipelotrichaceae bacterium]
MVFLGLSQLMKLPFSTEFLEADQLASFLFRALRYGVSVFATFGLYPYLFRYSLFA